MPVLHTQTTSSPRLKNDTLGDQALKDLYRVYERDEFEMFRLYAECVVQSGGGKQEMKDKIIAEFYKPLATKTTVLTKTQNFILAGMGLGV
jgi:hypothetical protein